MWKTSRRHSPHSEVGKAKSLPRKEKGREQPGEKKEEEEQGANAERSPVMSVFTQEAQGR